MADIFMLKYQARPSELHEGVAFFGRAGTALMKSCQRLKIDPLQLYGTNVVKCGDVREAQARGEVPRAPAPRAGDRRPQDHRRDGRGDGGGAQRADGAAGPAARVPSPARSSEFTPGTEVLVTPDIDASLDEQRLKAAFWRAFRRLGEWYDGIPPY